jgi:hypothetical protein
MYVLILLAGLAIASAQQCGQASCIYEGSGTPCGIIALPSDSFCMDGMCASRTGVCASAACLTVQNGEPCTQCDCACSLVGEPEIADCLFPATPAPTPPAGTPSPTPAAITPEPTPPVVTPAPTPQAVTPAPTPPVATPAPTPASTCSDVVCSIPGQSAAVCGRRAAAPGAICQKGRCVAVTEAGDPAPANGNCASTQCQTFMEGDPCELCNCACALLLEEGIFVFDCVPPTPTPPPTPVVTSPPTPKTTPVPTPKTTPSPTPKTGTTPAPTPELLCGEKVCGIPGRSSDRCSILEFGQGICTGQRCVRENNATISCKSSSCTAETEDQPCFLCDCACNGPGVLGSNVVEDCIVPPPPTPRPPVPTPPIVCTGLVCTLPGHSDSPCDTRPTTAFPTAICRRDRCVQTTKFGGPFEDTPLDCLSNECINKDDGEACFSCNCACGALFGNNTLFFRDCAPATTVGPTLAPTPAPTPFPTPEVVCTGTTCSVAGFESLPCSFTEVASGAQCIDNRCIDTVGTSRVNCSSTDCIGKAQGAPCGFCDCGCTAALNDFLIAADCVFVPTTTTTTAATNTTTPAPTCGNNVIEAPEECDGTAAVTLTSFQRCDTDSCLIRSVVPLWSLVAALSAAALCCCCIIAVLAVRRRRRRRAAVKRTDGDSAQDIPLRPRAPRRQVA